MLTYILRRFTQLVPMVVVISLVSFFLLQLPPGDYVTNMTMQLLAQGDQHAVERAEALRVRYGLDQPFFIQYVRWAGAMLRGDLGYSMAHNMPVSRLIGERLMLTIVLALVTLVISWGLAIPIGIYSATHKYKVSDYVLSFIAFVGIAVPNFMLAMVLMFFAVFYFGATSVGGLFSAQYATAPWSFAKLIDLMKHLPIPIIVLGLGGMAGTMRIMRGNLMDVMDQQYIQTARAKGLKERHVVYRHAVPVAINPLISRLGLFLPNLISGAVIISVVLNLPTVGPIFLRALLEQDMQLAGAIIFLLAITLVIGNLLADITLALVDPRIRLD